MKHYILSIFALCIAFNAAFAQGLTRVKPEDAGMDSKRLSKVDDAVNEAINSRLIPGAVVAVVRHKNLVYLKAFGNKQVYPDTVAMTTNTVFDLASVSKPTSTATALMILLEQGKLRLRDNVSRYIPDFKPWTSADGKQREQIEIIHLLTHTSGLPPYADVEALKKIYSVPNPDGLITHISNVKRNNPPGTVFDYSCLNFITLQRIIETISGMSLKEFSQKNIFTPLGMKHTDYNPSGETLALVAPTEKQADGSVLKGLVHDPLARVMNGGISGNAGVFSTAEDLSVLAAMLINKGQINGVRILSPLTVEKMTTVPKGYEKFGRTLGWDSYSAYKTFGDIFGTKSYGHTGYTGTSITIDPESETAVIILAHRVHPEDKGSMGRFRDVVANAVAGAVVK
ncbi:MAG: serine hydrolase [Dysgonamonadaceae bacterium]|jgi:CubicO group peptidase (beta-lactamase class C family)|nr:serine hydrolase [Dysgonamonadaceae bacterium]